MHHGEGLRRLLAAHEIGSEEQEALLIALAADRQGADLTPADRAMLEYVVKLTRRPGDVVRGDIEALRAHGFDDRGIHDICAITAYYAFVNRTADGLGVELESDRGNDPNAPGVAVPGVAEPRNDDPGSGEAGDRS